MATQYSYEFTTDKTWDDTPELASGAVHDVLVVGDIHGSKTHLTDAITHAAELGVQVIVQVGDFWLADRRWSRFSPLQAEYMQAACDSPLPIVVIDGNHEIWPALGRISGRIHIPAVLLDDACHARSEWKPVIAALTESPMTDWAKWGWIAGPNAGLSGEIAAEVIETNPQRVHAAARRKVIQETS